MSYKIESGSRAQWYIREFMDKESEISRARKQHSEELALARLEAAARRSYLVTVLGGAIGALLTFLFLPLLIQIEQNTRKLLEHEALTSHSPTTPANAANHPHPVDG